MIYYFSGTGNSRWIAEQLALITDDQALNIMDSPTNISVEGETLGIVFPVYAWGPPKAVLDFVKKLDGKPSFTYAVCSCGDEAGYTMKKLSKAINIDSIYSVIMPNNYCLGFELDSDEKVRKKLSKAKESLETIGLEILDKQSVSRVKVGKLAWLKSSLIYFAFNKFARSTKSFYATDECTSCGVCVKNCPTQTISLVNGKPKWGQECYHCTACINLCPEIAIQYGKRTIKRSRYSIDRYL